MYYGKIKIEFTMELNIYPKSIPLQSDGFNV